MLGAVDLQKASEEHNAMAALYTSLGVEVIEVMPDQPCLPNQMFVADLLVMTPRASLLRARHPQYVRAKNAWLHASSRSLGFQSSGP